LWFKAVRRGAHRMMVGVNLSLSGHYGSAARGPALRCPPS